MRSPQTVGDVFGSARQLSLGPATSEGRVSSTLNGGTPDGSETENGETQEVVLFHVDTPSVCTAIILSILV